MRFWAHRGCSQRYPENTATAFERAAELTGLTGIETDVQRTRDGALVIIHDERVDRTTDGTGWVKDYSLRELQALRIGAGHGRSEHILTLDELLDLLAPRLREGLLLNIELKNSQIHYEGMEAELLELVHKKGLAEHIIYSTFYPRSLGVLNHLDPTASLAVLATNASDCLILKKGLGNPDAIRAIHPYWRSIDLTLAELHGMTVRAWMSGHLYPEKPTGTKLDVHPLEQQGITDIMMNEPEMYIH